MESDDNLHKAPVKHHHRQSVNNMILRLIVEKYHFLWIVAAILDFSNRNATKLLLDPTNKFAKAKSHRKGRCCTTTSITIVCLW